MIEETELEIYKSLSNLQTKISASQESAKSYQDKIDSLERSKKDYVYWLDEANKSISKIEKQMQVEREKLKAILGVPTPCPKCVEPPTGRKFR